MRGETINARPVGDQSNIDFSQTDPFFWNEHFAVVRTELNTFSYLDREGRIGSKARPDRFGIAMRYGLVDGKVQLESSTGQPLGKILYDNVMTTPEGWYIPVQVDTKWGLVDHQARMVRPPQFDSIGRIWRERPCWRVEQGGQYGAMDPKGLLLTPVCYEDVAEYTHGMFAVKKNGKWGVVGNGGARIVEAIYDAVVIAGTNTVWGKRDKWGMYALDGTALLPPEYDEVSPLYTYYGAIAQGYWVVTQAGLHGVASSKGSLRILPKFTMVSYRADDVVSVSKNGMEGAVDLRTGRYVAPVEFSRIIYWSCFGRRNIVVNYRQKWGLIDFETGRYLLPTQYDSIVSWQKLVCVCNKGRFALFSPSGDPALPWKAGATELPRADKPLVNGVGKVVCAGKAGLIGENGRIVLTCRYEDVGALSEGLVAAKQDGTWGYVDLAGEWVIPPQYEEEGAFRDGYAAVRLGGQVGLINKKGTVKVPFQYKDAGYVYNGRFPAAVEKDGKVLWGIVDLQGQVVLPLDYDCVEWVDLMPDTTRYHGKPGWLEF